MNLVDLFAIVPFFLDLIIGGLQVRLAWLIRVTERTTYIEYTTRTSCQF